MYRFSGGRNVSLRSLLLSATGFILHDSVSVEFDRLEAHFTSYKEEVDLVQAGGSFEQLVSCCSKFNTSVLVLSSQVPWALDGGTVGWLLRETPSTRLIVYLADAAEQFIEEFLLLGYYGIILPETPTSTWVEMLRCVIRDEMWVDRRILTRVLQQVIASRDCDFTRRELEILGLVADGMSNGAIAERLFVTPETIRWHLRHLYRKTSARSRSKLMKFASGYLASFRQKSRSLVATADGFEVSHTAVRGR
jgi:DNA-binding NarL/FixJ family response regulator